MLKVGWIRWGLLALLLAAPAAGQQSRKPAAPAARAVQVCRDCLRAHMEFLASDALRGRASGSGDERIAAEYIAAQLRQYGVEPVEGDSLLQRVEMVQPVVKAPPVLVLATTPPQRWQHGQDIVVFRTSGEPFRARMVASDSEEVNGAAVLLAGPPGSPRAIFKSVLEYGARGAAAVLVPENEAVRKYLEPQRGKPVEIRKRLKDTGEARATTHVIFVSAGVAAQLQAAPAGTFVSLDVERGEPQVTATWNAVGVLHGSDPKLRGEAILLSAHLDGQGTGSGAGDQIFNSADDDASGVATVLELARLLAAGPKPRRTVIFALYGSEEEGGYGSQSFREHPPVAREKIAANLQFEMVGRPDPKVGEKLWLTGYERSTLGPMLAKQGAPIVADPYPDQNFFQRSDNYGMARMGVVAHTVSSFGLHADYHQPGDEVSKIDFAHMERAVRSLVAPIRWLANTAERPEWKKGMKP